MNSEDISAFRITQVKLSVQGFLALMDDSPILRESLKGES